jgi:large subunit ribosomal protein L29
MSTQEIRGMTTEELTTKLADTRQELMNLRFQIETGQQTDTSRLKVTRRLIALYETILRERELGINQKLEKEAEKAAAKEEKKVTEKDTEKAAKKEEKKVAEKATEKLTKKVGEKAAEKKGKKNE